MAAIAYRIDGTPRTYSQLFPLGPGATYDDYGVNPTPLGIPKTITLAGSGVVTATASTPTITIGHSSTVTVPHSSTVTVTQTDALILPEE